MKWLIKTIYSSLPLKRQALIALRHFVRPPESIYQHLYFDGDFVVKVDDAHSFRIHHYGFEVENSLFWAGLTGGWEKTSLRLWKKLVEDADVIADVGANTGVYSLLSKSLKPGVRVVAFEPIRRVYQKLENNVRLNNFSISCF